ncbi:membrane lipoprotein lipid attachment site-containing protein [Actinoplanes sp. LDG1-06]|uniref:Membrane lipoprotein lipid attachment site-containing protein n=1 Tax=Paractinoplanes ovalisporus TaxID=2810368 RepID=A0ABS2AEI7_9ACTN|nr:lipoprotein [Actinoplanes ovalisporus]MBM2618251.1 membrane lipoprotein lipid attachment site-containing protein [Actinoplanes ovalisporus]
MKRSFSFILAVLLVAACSKPEQTPTWTRIDLPADGPVVLTDVADCDGTWWAVGAVRTGATETRPAAWTGDPWTEVRFVPRPESYYGPRQIIRSVACADGRVAMVGSVPGGAHGNPRVSTWRRQADGRMTENKAPFETYGGDEAIDVGPIAASRQGFAIAGTRTSGAAAWLSSDGVTFTLDESDRAGTSATGITARPDGSWLITGTGADQQPAAWVVDDGRWAPAAPPPPVRETGVDSRNSPVEPVAVAERGPTRLMAGDDSLWQTTG